MLRRIRYNERMAMTRRRMSLFRLLGAVLIVVGIVGLFLPIFQGLLFILVGLYLVTLGHPETRAWVRKHLGRVPKALAIFDDCDVRVRRWFKISEPL